MSRRTTFALRLILAAWLAINACAGLQSNAPTPNAPTPVPVIPTPAPALDSTAAPPGPSPTFPTGFALRPTATQYEPASAQEGTFVNPDYGVSMKYPTRWSTQPGDSPNVLSWFVSPGNAVYAVLFIGELAADKTLQDAAADIREASLGGLADFNLISDDLIKLDDGRDAWATVATGVRTDDNARIKVSLTTTARGGRTYSLLVFGAPDDYSRLLADIAFLVGSLHVEAPQLYGIPRGRALILQSGESTNPREYDPATTHGVGDKLVFTGLVSFDPHLNLVPDLAERWEVTAGTVYTFHLRPNARFHNGRPVTAYDMIYSWERAADPATESDTVLTYLGDIVGVREKHEGKADHIGGLQALDDHTLQVTIDAPKPYFLLKLTYPTAFVVDKANVESGPDWFRAPNGTGPYRLARWDSFQLVLYERNEDFYLGPPAIPYVIVQLYAGDSVRLYENGEVDVAYVGAYDLPRVSDPNNPMHTELLSGVGLCTGYIVFDVTQPPFDDVKVRQAFTMAFDRSKYIDVVLLGNALPAQGVFPPGLPGFNPDLQGLPYDPGRARQLLAESKYGGPEGLPTIVYTSGGFGSAVGGSVAALAQMWQQIFGVTITIENLEPDRYNDLLRSNQHGQIFSGGWCADYPDPENFADVLFHSGASENLGHYSNPELDALLEQARVEPDVTKRIALYQQAEQMIVNDAPVIFTAHGLSHVLVKPHIKGFTLTPIDVPLERYLSIDASLLEP